MAKKIGELLIQKGLITERDLQFARFEQRRTSARLGAILVRLKLVTEVQIARVLSEQFGLPFVDLVENPPDPPAIALIPAEFALKRCCVACGVEQSMLTVAMCDPLALTVVQDLEFATGYRIRQVIAVRSQILEALAKGYSEKALAAAKSAGKGLEMLGSGGRDNKLEHEEKPALAQRVTSSAEREYFETAAPTRAQAATDEAPVVRLADCIIKEAIASKASDIHIEPSEKGVAVRQRFDGLLRVISDLPKWVHEGLVGRIKVMASMDIAEKRLPQDGRIRIGSKEEGEIDLRVSSLNTLYGEKIVLRVLDHSKGVPPPESLGLSPANLQQFHYLLRHQRGMVLTVGPTGSGKSTTLASAVSTIKSFKTNIVTIEDPIEYRIPGINQTQINEKAKLTFASSLRSILRQDPDVILVGEIRDQETAKIAMQAAQTGHLVLSTLHTEDAPSTITRLMDMNVEPYIIGSSLLGVIAQRLLRRLCAHCRARYTPPPDVLKALNLFEDEAQSLPFFRAEGCDRCHMTGYTGRIAIYEIMHVSNRIARLISQRAGEDAIRDAAQEAGMTTLGEDGLAKVKAGITSPEELLRVVTEVREIRTLCPECTFTVGFNFIACPNCGRRLGGGCTRCGRALQIGWTFCPFCASSCAQRSSRPQEVPAPHVAEFRRI